MTSHGACVVSIATTKESFDRNIAPKGGEAPLASGQVGDHHGEHLWGL